MPFSKIASLKEQILSILNFRSLIINLFSKLSGQLILNIRDLLQSRTNSSFDTLRIMSCYSCKWLWRKQQLCVSHRWCHHAYSWDQVAVSVCSRAPFRPAFFTKSHHFNNTFYQGNNDQSKQYYFIYYNLICKGGKPFHIILYICMVQKNKEANCTRWDMYW